MLKSRIEFESQSPHYITGRLWRRLLVSRKKPPQGQNNLEAWVKDYCKDFLEIEKTFPAFVKTYWLMPLTRLCQLATEQLVKQCDKRNLSWNREMYAYVKQWQTYNQNIDQELKYIQLLLDRLFAHKIDNKTVAEWLIAYDDDPLMSVRPFHEHPAFQHLLAHNNSGVFALIHDYWFTTKRLEAFLTDMVLVNDWLDMVTIKDSQKFLLEDTYRAYYLSSSGLLFFLAGQHGNISALWNAPMEGSLIPPCELLKHLETEEWNIILKYQIGLRFYDFEEFLTHQTPTFLETFPFSVALTHAQRSTSCENSSYVRALLTIPSWLTQLTDANFIDIIIKMEPYQITQFVLNQESSNGMLVRFANLLNERNKRNEFFALYSKKSFFSQHLNYWLLDQRFLSGLNLAAFKACFKNLWKKKINELLKKQPEFLKKILSYEKDDLIALIGKNKDNDRIVDVLLKQPSIIYKLDSDDDLIKVINMSLRCPLEKLRQKNPILDTRLTSSFLLKLIVSSSAHESSLSKSETLMSRFSIQDKARYLEKRIFGSIVERFIQDSKVISLLSTQRLSILLLEEDTELRAWVKNELRRREHLADPVSLFNHADVPVRTRNAIQYPSDESAGIPDPSRSKPTPARLITHSDCDSSHRPLFTLSSHAESGHAAIKPELNPPKSDLAKTVAPPKLMPTAAEFMAPAIAELRQKSLERLQEPPSFPNHVATNAIVYTDDSKFSKSKISELNEDYSHRSFFWLFFERFAKTLFIMIVATLAVSMLIPFSSPVMISLAVGLGVALFGCLICFARFAVSQENCYPHTNAWGAFFLPSDDCYDEKHYTKQVDQDDTPACTLC